MNKNIFEGKWDQFKGSVKKNWGELTDDDLREIEGNRDRLVGKIKERYGKSQEEADKEVNDYENKMRRNNDARRDDHINPKDKNFKNDI